MLTAYPCTAPDGWGADRRRASGGMRRHGHPGRSRTLSAGRFLDRLPRSKSTAGFLKRT